MAHAEIFQMKKMDSDAGIFGVKLDTIKNQMAEGLFKKVAVMRVKNLDHVFEVGNYMAHDSEERIHQEEVPWSIRRNNGKLISMRSVSIGDVIRYIDPDRGTSQLWVCDAYGWTSLTSPTKLPKKG